eukprot:TRINITY_DN26661_c0_g1_i9.p1 TRINITY_DN26661_c0_g1~~TRINITY_DN26661_c0_g1_i9.p1  ORF type:complete len:269 (+),score=50.17 TRINITY_DN26661_c0_g1_i9:71-877(+)
MCIRDSINAEYGAERNKVTCFWEGVQMSAAAKRLESTSTLEINAVSRDRYETILSEDALAFVADLELRFGERRTALMQARTERQKRFDAGELPDFLPETKNIRESDWKILSTPENLKDRRVEITGPVDRKMMINAFNSGANVFMTDFEDASAPVWENMIDGQLNLYDYARDQLEFADPKSGKEYQMGKNAAVLKVRPRGWHMLEGHALLDGEPISASLFDFGLYIFHNAKALLNLSLIHISEPTRLLSISYAVFCLKKKKKKKKSTLR